MSRIDELQKKYPTIPRDVIIKWDLLSRGVRDSDDLDKISERAPARGSYQTYDHDLTLMDVVENRPWRLKPGFMLRPSTVDTAGGPRLSHCRQ